MNNIIKYNRLLISGAVVALLLAGAGPAAAEAQWKPEKNVEVVVGVNPGGSMDRTARDVQGLLQKALVGRNSTVVNRPGGGHSIALNYLAQQRGDPHYLQVIHFLLFTNFLTGRTPLNHTSVTPIALLFNENFGFAVKADSPIKTAADMVQRLKKDPGSLSISVSTGLGTVNHILAARVGQVAGVDPKKMKFVVFNSASEGITSVAGGHVDVTVTTLFSIQAMVEKGLLRFIAVVTPKRMTGAMAPVPTLREQGIDVDMASWRSVVAPAGLSAAQIAYWDDMFSRMTKSEEWRASLERNFLSDHYLSSADTRKFFDSEFGKYKFILTELGMTKQ